MGVAGLPGLLKRGAFRREEDAAIAAGRLGLRQGGGRDVFRQGRPHRETPGDQPLVAGLGAVKMLAARRLSRCARSLSLHFSSAMRWASMRG